MYAKLYERNEDLDSARRIFRKAAQQPFRSLDDLASVWCEFAEMEIRNFNYQNALEILREVRYLSCLFRDLHTTHLCIVGNNCSPYNQSSPRRGCAKETLQVHEALGVPC